MKKPFPIVIKIFLALILLIFILLISIPVIFKDQIRLKVEQTINESVNATVRFEDYKLGFFRNFPNLSFSMKNLSIVGINSFENDTLAGFGSFNLVFNLSSLFKDTGYEVKSVVMDRAVVNAIILKDGSVNWDIMKDTGTSETEEETSDSDMIILLEKVILRNSSISYIDNESDMSAYLNDVNFQMSGDMTASETDLQMAINAAEFTFIMEGMKYLNKTVMDSEIDMLADLDTWKFTFRENYLTINDLKLIFTGTVIMPDDDIETDIQFLTPQTSFKTLLSLVPAVYMNDYKDLSASGEFLLSGSAKGIYSDADSTLPDISLNMSVTDGLISYPSLPEQIKNINIKTEIFVDGKDLDKTVIDVSRFHMELAGSPFDMDLLLKTPMSDPDFKGSMAGRIDLTALSNAVPMDSISLSGVIDMSVQMAGRMSMIEKEQYESFKASGSMNIKDMMIAMKGYPEVQINEAGFEFSPAYATLTNTNLNVGGKSDFTLTGTLENYLPYVFRDQTIKGKLSLRSRLTDVSEIMSKMSLDTTSVEDTASLIVIQVPKNIDFDFDALIEDFNYDNIKAKNVKGHLIVRDGVLSLKETGMDILGGTISLNADYDTRDSLKPVMKADFNMKNIAVKDAFNTFNTVKKLAPAAKGIDGRINASLNYVSLLGSDMMPVVQSINGGGKLQSDEITLLESSAYTQMKDVLKLGDKYSNTFKDINISFTIKDGRIYVSPFDTKVGNIKMNVSGDQGIDQTINYLIKTEIPRSDLGNSVNSLIDNLSAQASSFGIAFKPADILKVNVKVTGSFNKPVVAPVFGSASGESSGSGITESVKETVKETISNTVDKGKEQLRQEAEAQGDKLIQEAELRGQQLRDEAARAAEKIKQEAEVQAQNLIDGAATKGAIAKLGAQKGADGLRREADKRALQLTQEADARANKLVEEAKAKKTDLINSIRADN